MRRFVIALALIALTFGGATPAAADRWYTTTPVLGIVDAGREPAAARRAGATWDRALFLWQEVQPNGPSDWALDSYLDPARLRPTLSAGMAGVGVVQGTPGWAAGDFHDGAPRGPSGPAHAG